MKKAVIYTRVSSEEQVKGNSLDEQEKKSKYLIQAQDFEYVRTYKEEGISGASTDRPALNQLLEDAKNGVFEVLVFYKIDRLSRSFKYFLELVETFTKYGIEIRSVQESFDNSNHTGKLMIHMLASFAEYEREIIRERSMMGRTASMKKGVWHGSSPFGYDKGTNKHLVINEKEADYVRKMFDLFVNKNPAERMTLHKVQKVVNSWNIATKIPAGRKKTNGATFWCQRTIGRILTNPAYIGETFIRQYTQGTVANSRKLERPVNDRIKMITPQIIKKDVFDLVQRELGGNKINARRNRKQETMLGRLLRCSECNKKYSRNISRNNIYYRCNSHSKATRESPCQSKSIRGDRIEKPVWDILTKLLSDKKLVMEKLEEIKKQKFDGVIVKTKIKNYKDDLDNSKKQRVRLIDMHIEGHLTTLEYASRLEVIERTIVDLQTKIMNEEVYLSENNRRLGKIYDLAKLTDTVGDRLETLSYERKADIAHLLVKDVLIDGDKATVTLGLPLRLKEGLQQQGVERIYRII